jgi:hypothetical protein
MKKSLFCFLFLALNHVLNAQFADLIKDKNVAWVGESTIDVRLDMLHDKALYEEFDRTKYVLEGLDILKIQADNIEIEEGFSVFATILLEAAKNKQIVAYSDSLCLHPIDVINVITKSDTIYPCFATTYEIPGYTIVQNALNAEDIKVFRVYAITSYSPKNGRWNSQTMSIAPLKMISDEAGRFISWQPIFWVKVDNKKIDINSRDITWAARTRPRGQEGMLHLNTLKVHKKTEANMPMLHFLELAKNNKQMRLYKGARQKKEQLTFNEIQTIFCSTDTIIKTNPITDKQTIVFKENKLDVNEINQVRLVQEWAWNDKRKTLSVRTLGIAPMKQVNNEAGEFLYIMSLFYQRFDD